MPLANAPIPTATAMTTSSFWKDEAEATRKLYNKMLRKAAHDYGYRVRFTTRGKKYYATFRDADGGILDHASVIRFRTMYMPKAQLTSYGITFTVRLNPDA